MKPEDHIRVAIQGLLDSLGDGWTLAQYVIIMGIERVTDGEIEATSWYWCPSSQPEWMTDGLIDHGVRLREDDPTNDY